jgi:hypothetical protein
MLLTGFFALLHLGEMTFPVDKRLQNWRKVTKRSSVSITSSQYEFHLPSHKADRFFEGNHIIVRNDQFLQIKPLTHFKTYLTNRDRLFPLSSPLWLTSSGAIPNRNFFISRLHHFFHKNIGGQSMRAGGATSFAEHGVSPSLIQLMGRWSSEAFLVYIQKNLVLIQALLYANRE